MYVNKATTFTASATSVNVDTFSLPAGMGPLWMHIHCTSGGALSCYYSPDGVAWRTLTASLTGALTAVTNYGFAATAPGSGTDTASCTCLSFANAMTAN